jgi:hypothetical protein
MHTPKSFKPYQIEHISESQDILVYCRQKYKQSHMIQMEYWKPQEIDFVF